MGRPDVDAGLHRLRGWNSGKLRGYGWLTMAASGLVGAPIFLESFFKSFEVYYGLSFFLATLITVIVGATLVVRGSAKCEREIAAGYTVDIAVAIARPGLYLVSWRDLQVVSRPYQPRPLRRTRRAVLGSGVRRRR
jgi:uncharacterized membrane protein YeaQ/YmgE (transglycosylase-associated protein family)